jgi:hypothetical protein
MYDEVSSSNPPNLPVPAEGAYVWHLEVIVVAVGIDPVSREYETGPVADSTSIIKKKKNNNNFKYGHESYVTVKRKMSSRYQIQIIISLLLKLLNQLIAMVMFINLTQKLKFSISSLKLQIILRGLTIRC